MARRIPTSTPISPALTIDQLNRCITKFERCIAELEAFNPQTVQKRFQIPEVVSIEISIKDALDAAFGHKTPAYLRYELAANLDTGPVIMRGSFWGNESSYDAQEVSEARQYLAEGKQRSIALLRRAIQALKDQISDQEATTTVTLQAANESAAHSRKIFVVHGREEGPREAIARFLERLGLKPIILREQANQGRAVIEKIEAYGDVGFAV